MTQLFARTGPGAGTPAARSARALRAVDAGGINSAGSPAELPSLFVTCDVDGYCRSAGTSGSPWPGLDPVEVVGRHLVEVLGDRLHAVNGAAFRAALDGRHQVLENTLHDHLGRERHVEIAYLPELGADGDVHGVLVHARDVTERVRERTNLVEAQQLGGLGSWAWERDAGLVASPEVARLLGEDPAEWEASVEAAAERIHGDDLPRLAERLRDTLARGGGWEQRHRVVRADGLTRHVLSRVRVVIGSDGLPLRAWGTALDVTGQTQQQQETEAHVQRLGDTMAMLGHDVRQPLTAVLGFLDEADHALRRTDLDDAAGGLLRACVDKGGRAGRRMRRLLDDILAVASVDAGTLVARPERVRLGTLVAEVVEEVRMDVTVTGAEGVLVRADLFHLRQALANLLVNAGRYGRPGFEVSVSRSGDWVELVVSDHGDGVAEEFVPGLFDRFSRGLGSGHGDRAGAGLGLHLVRSLVEANGGTARYAGVTGEGARFVLTLPAA